MHSVLAALHRPANSDSVLVEQLGEDGTAERTWTYAQVRTAAGSVGALLARAGIDTRHRVGLVAANTAEWVVADLALLSAGIEEVPLPLTFSTEQAEAMLDGVDACLADTAGLKRLEAWGLADRVTVVDVTPALTVSDALRPAPGAGPAGTPAVADDDIVKTIHTSGTTGLPKGVRLRRAGIDALLASLDEVTPDTAFRRFLSLVPLSLLIEQVVAVYMPVLRGGRVVFLPPQAALLGTAGSQAADAVDWLATVRPTSAVLPPAAVTALDTRIATEAEAHDLLGDELPFFMAGGAPVDVLCLERLDRAGVRIYEGYGLSENGSVVSWNRPGHLRFGTAGQPLPHCEVRIDDSAELLVRSPSLFVGYSVEDPTSRPVDADGWLHTGDRAEIDDDGFVRLLGRTKNVIITANGRNVSPEWVETRLRTCEAVSEAVVFGDGLEHLVAVVLTGSDGDAATVTESVLAFATANLAETDVPDTVVVVGDTHDVRERYFTVTGRPRRDAIYDGLVLGALEPAA
jgi:long-chain acyl-CoA synthetase